MHHQMLPELTVPRPDSAGPVRIGAGRPVIGGPGAGRRGAGRPAPGHQTAAARSAWCCICLALLSGCTVLSHQGTASVPGGQGTAPVQARIVPTNREPAPRTPVAAQAGEGQATLQFGTLTPAIRAEYVQRVKGKDGQVFALDPAQSDIRIYAFRAGVGARFGHNHVMRVPRFSGLAWLPEKGLAQGSADFGFRLTDLDMDPPDLRASTGGSFAAPLKPSDIAGTREHLLSDEAFQASSFPWIQASLRIETGEVPIALGDLALTVHGETHHQRVVLRVRSEPGVLEASGTLSFRQGDFGLKPYSVMGGLLSVDELVAIEFRLRGVPLPAGSL